MRIYSLFLIAALAFFSPHWVFAAVSPVSVTVFPPIQFPADNYTITGGRFSILWGRQRDLYGLDVGVLGNITDETFVGIGISGLLNLTGGTTTILGLQLAGLANINTNKTQIYGLQATLGINSNTASSSIVGLQIAPIANLSPYMNIYGIQAGIYNRALSVYGFQIGVVNVVKNLHGIQIGLLNFNEGGLFFVAPVLNIGF